MPEPLSIIISANPRSGAASGLVAANQLRDRLEVEGYHAELFTDIQAMAQRADQLHTSGELRTVVAAGGDGTASLVLGLIPSDVPLALFPLGSENLLAKYFDIDRNIETMLVRIRAMRSIELDLFHANGKLSLLMTSAGFDAEVVRQVHTNRTSHITRWRYRWAILRAMCGYAWPRFRLAVCDENGEWHEQGEFNWLFAFNVPKYAAGISIIEDGRIDDGLLEIGTFRGGGLIRGLWHYAMVGLKKHHGLKSWQRFQVSAVRLQMVGNEEPTNRRVPYQVDGDWGGTLPLEIQYSGRRARILVDPGRLDRVPPAN